MPRLQRNHQAHPFVPKIIGLRTHCFCRHTVSCVDCLSLEAEQLHENKTLIYKCNSARFLSSYMCSCRGEGLEKERTSHWPAEQDPDSTVCNDSARVVINDCGGCQRERTHDETAGQERAGCSKHASIEAQQEQQRLRCLRPRKIPHSPAMHCREHEKASGQEALDAADIPALKRSRNSSGCTSLSPQNPLKALLCSAPVR